jgi:hypothetical protein
MTRRTIRYIATATMLTVGSSSIGCGYYLYPQRRGNRSDVDAGTLVMDLLWLLPGLIPGIIALAVDFSSGAIYTRGRTAVLLSPDGRVAVRLPRASRSVRLEFRLVTRSGRILARQNAVIGPATRDGESVELRVTEAMRSEAAPTGVPGGARPTEEMFLEVQSENGATSRFPTAIEARVGTGLGRTEEARSDFGARRL